MTPAEQMAPPAAPAEPQYRITFAIQKVGDARVLQVSDTPVTVPLMVENAVIAKLIKAHTHALAQHDAGELGEVIPPAAQEPTIQ